MMLLIITFILAILVYFIWINGTFLKTEYDIEKDYYDDERYDMTEIQFELIKAGIQAGSSHNMQPWKVKISDLDKISLYADTSKDLSIVDSERKQMLISQGTFIFALRNKAKAMGVDLYTEYADLDISSDMPLVANFKIANLREKLVDGVSSGTAVIKSDNPKIDMAKINKMFYDSYPEFKFKFVEGKELGNFKEHLKKGTIIESSSQLAMEELLNIFRFSKWERNRYRYGLSLNTVDPTVRFFADPILKMTAKGDSFGNSSIKAFEKRLIEEEGYLVIFIERTPLYKDYIKVGELMGDITSKSNGYLIKPAVQVLENIQGMEGINNQIFSELKIDGHILLILGFTKDKGDYHESMRHKVMDIVMKKRL